MNTPQVIAKPLQVTAALLFLGAGCLVGPMSWAAESADEPAGEVLTRGPVHEAFSGVVVYNPTPGLVIAKAPPAPIEEVPPDEKPAGDNVVWIAGYWAWDDERDDFVWVSGVWRALPPGRQWIPGYWVKAATGYQWTAGYWADAGVRETTYLPAPPATLEHGPNIEAPSPDYFWTPGYWVWYDGRYAWRPGYWVLGQPDRVWCPAYYTWTPRGYVYVDGFWDYSVEYRGVLFAPVYFGPRVYVRSGYYYSPRIVIDLAVFPTHLFYRPRYSHCYFGDYYAVSYYRSGFYASYTFQSRRYGYDPIYCHRRWVNRHDRGWENRVANDYKYRRDNVAARPPRTWTAQRSISATAVASDRNLSVASSFEQIAKRPDSRVRYQPVAKEEKQQIIQRGQEIRQTRDERRALERPVSTGKFQPSTGKQPQSPIVAPAPVVPKRSEPTVIRGGGQQPENPSLDRSGRRDVRQAVEPPSRREPENIRPQQRELPPPRQNFQRREPTPQPQPQPPVNRELSPAPNPLTDMPRESGKGEERGEGRGERRGDGRGDRNKDADQQAPGRR
ncbi:MAG: hypothetical protein PCFJNLEI_04080 [Verrucomicrobiae bacterium]|nr:hypothetical protein [Verrucomicrobiae bacterium]